MDWLRESYSYLVLGIVILPLVLWGYLSFAKRFNIIDKPNERSSHTFVTVRGGGIVFTIALLLWFVMSGFHLPYFVLGVVLIALVSFIDDIRPLSTKPRLLVHFITVVLMLYDLGFSDFAWYWWLIAFVLTIGWINAFNFMDGINGITAFYALSVLIPVLIVNQNNSFVDSRLILISMISLVVFAFFNARKRALCFAGDVGSVVMASILAFMIIGLVINTGRWQYVMFLAIYGVDTVLTIIQRLLRGENIFKAHRSHLYQFLANEMQLGHLRVSILYAFLQLLISCIIIWASKGNYFSQIALMVLLLLAGVYLLVKTRVMKYIGTMGHQNV